MKRIAAFVLPLALAPLVALAQHEHAPDHAHDAAKAAAPAASPLDRLKKLAGTWEGTAKHGEQAFPTTVTWRVTGGGSAVSETLFEGTPMEMLTVYTVQGGRIVLTHYCAGGNQPFMRERRGSSANELAFEFAGGANLDPAKDSHMHSGAITFVDDDHLRSEWQSWDGGKPTTKAVFELARRR